MKGLSISLFSSRKILNLNPKYKISSIKNILSSNVKLSHVNLISIRLPYEKVAHTPSQPPQWKRKKKSISLIMKKIQKEIRLVVDDILI